MRAILLGLLVALPPLLAGCAGDADPRDPSPSEGNGALVAYHEDADEGYGNLTIFAVRDDATALRVVYARDHTGVARLAPGVDLPAEQMDALFRPDALDRRAGGLVLRVEEGRVPDEALSALLASLAPGWPSSDAPEAKFHESETFVDLREPRLARLREQTAEGTLLRESFLAARRAFHAERRVDADLAGLPALDGCARVATTATPEAAPAGSEVRVRIEIQNCGDAPIRIGTTPCDGAPLLMAQVHAASTHLAGVLPATEAPSPAYAIDLRCRGEGDVLEIPPGVTRVVQRAWDGTFAACRTRDDCESSVAEPGTIRVHAYVPTLHEARSAEVTLLPRGAPSVPLLLVKEHDWVNGTAEGWIEGNFGGHCAPARYALDPPALTLRFHPYDPDDPPDAFVLRDFRDSPRPNHTMTMSADRIELVEARNGTATLASPFDRDAVVALVVVEGDAFVVNGTRLAPGQTTTLRAAMDVQGREGATFRTESVLVFRNLGRAHVLQEEAGGCM